MGRGRCLGLRHRQARSRDELIDGTDRAEGPCPGLSTFANCCIRPPLRFLSLSLSVCLSLALYPGEALLLVGAAAARAKSDS